MLTSLVHSLNQDAIGILFCSFASWVPADILTPSDTFSWCVFWIILGLEFWTDYHTVIDTHHWELTKFMGSTGSQSLPLWWGWWSDTWWMTPTRLWPHSFSLYLFWFDQTWHNSSLHSIIMEFSLHFHRDAYIPEYHSSGTAVDGFLMKSVVWGFMESFMVAHWPCKRKLDEYVRNDVGVSERGSMQHWQAQHQAVLGHGRRQKARSGGGCLIRLLWISGYLTVTLGALFSTFFYPDLLSILRTRNLNVQPYVLPKVSAPIVKLLAWA